MSAGQLGLWGKAAYAPSHQKSLHWSVSRHRKFQNCLRRYYLHHFITPDVFEALFAPVYDANDLRTLKKLTNRYAWLGELVHAQVERVVAAWLRGEDPALENIVNDAVTRMRSQYLHSLQGLYRTDGKAAHGIGLVEHEHQLAVGHQEWIALREKLKRCLQHFFALAETERWRALRHDQVLALEKLLRFTFHGATVHLKSDLTLVDAETTEITIIDWKTGAPDSAQEAFQLTVYGLYYRISPDAHRAGLSQASMGGVAVHLNDGTQSAALLDEAALGRGQQTVQHSIADMRDFHRRLAESKNPLLVAKRTEDLYKCRLCPFQSACGRKGAP